MRMVSTPVLGGAALVTAPMLWQGLVTGERPLEPTLERYLVVVVGVWIALSVLEMLVGAAPRAGREGTDGGGARPLDDGRPAGSTLG